MPRNPNAPLTAAGGLPRLDPGAVLTVAGLFVAFTILTVVLLQPSELAGRVLSLAVGVGLSVLALGLALLLSGRRRPLASDGAPAANAGPVDDVAEQLEQAWAAQRAEEAQRAGQAGEPEPSGAGPADGGPGSARRPEPPRSAAPPSGAPGRPLVRTAARPQRPVAGRSPSPVGPPAPTAAGSGS